jgi:hypothetical protein
MTLKAGAIQANGTLPADSMAAAIEAAMNELVPPRANEDPMGRRKMALAIARGVIKHLGANASSITVTVPNTPSGGATHSQGAAVAVDLGGWS